MVAQSVEQWPFKPLAVGSSPTQPTRSPKTGLDSRYEILESSNVFFMFVLFSKSDTIQTMNTNIYTIPIVLLLMFYGFTVCITSDVVLAQAPDITNQELQEEETNTISHIQEFLYNNAFNEDQKTQQKAQEETEINEAIRSYYMRFFTMAFLVLVMIWFLYDKVLT